MEIINKILTEVVTDGLDAGVQITVNRHVPGESHLDMFTFFATAPGTTEVEKVKKWCERYLVGLTYEDARRLWQWKVQQKHGYPRLYGWAYFTQNRDCPQGWGMSLWTDGLGRRLYLTPTTTPEEVLGWSTADMFDVGFAPSAWGVVSFMHQDYDITCNKCIHDMGHSYPCETHSK